MGEEIFSAPSIPECPAYANFRALDHTTFHRTLLLFRTKGFTNDPTGTDLHITEKYL